MSDVEAKRIGAVSEVTMAMPIRRGRVPGEFRTFRQKLEHTLASVTRREIDDIPTAIRIIDQIHYARWWIQDGPDDNAYLWFTSNYDGSMKDYFRSFSLELSEQIDSIWSNCENYPERGAADFEELWKYVKRHQLETDAFYSGYRQLTVPHIRKLAALEADLVALAAEGRSDDARDALRRAETLDRFVPPLQDARTEPDAIKAEHLARIQPNILSGGLWGSVSYAFLEIVDPDAFGQALARLLRHPPKWLHLSEQSLRDQRGATTAPPRAALGVGFTLEGLKQLRLPATVLAHFPDAFRQGMAARASLLGDDGDWAPEHWSGELGSAKVGAVLVLHAAEPAPVPLDKANDEHTALAKETLADLWQALTVASGSLQTSGTGELLDGSRLLHQEVGIRMTDGRGNNVEPFGFRDGVSQPAINGIASVSRIAGGGALTAAGCWRPLSAGEFILGYADEDGYDLLDARDGLRDVGQFGTFLVFRKLRQNVSAFNAFLKEHAGRSKGDQDRFAARLVGREKDGQPLGDDGSAPNDFRFRLADGSASTHGQACPVGAHVRRVNPRDDQANTKVNRHRIIRRGMPYLSDGEWGLLFACYNARIEEQFEFLQSEWINKGNFIHQSTTARDPIAANNRAQDAEVFIDRNGHPPIFRMPQLVTLRGGDYFFVPGVHELIAILDGKIAAAGGNPTRSEPGRIPEADAESDDPLSYLEDSLKPHFGRLLAEQRVVHARLSGWRSEVEMPQPWRSGSVYYLFHPGHCVQVLSDTENFSSRHAGLKAEALERHGRPMLLGMPPGPKRTRRLDVMTRLFSGVVPAAFEALAQQTATMAVASAKRDTIELVDRIAYMVPLMRIIHVLGIDGPERILEHQIATYFARRDIREIDDLGWRRYFPEYTDAEVPFVGLRFLITSIATDLLINTLQVAELHFVARRSTALLQDLVDQAFRNPKPGSVVARAVALAGDAAEGADFTEEAKLALLEIVVGGLDTTAKGIASVVDRILWTDDLRHAAERALSEPRGEALNAVIVRALAMSPVAPLMFRTAEADVAIESGAGEQQVIAKDSLVILVAQAALGGVLHGGGDNAALRPFLFGDGIHRCFGEHYAMAEIRGVLRALLTLKGLRPAAGPNGRLQLNHLRLPQSLHIRFDR